MKSKVLITGGLGFIGSNLSLYLKDNYQVRILDNYSGGSQNGKWLANFAEIIEGDVTNYDDCIAALDGVTHVVHLAAKGSVIESINDPLSNLNSNVVGTVNLLRAVAKHKIKRFVFSSTGGALMGDCELPVNEQSIPKPISPYGASKLACEGYCSAYAHSFGIPITVLRFANVYGPHSHHKKGIMNAILKNLQSNTELTIFGDGEASRDFIYVDDICLGLTLALERSPTLFNTYHIGTGIETSLNHLVSLFERASGKSIKTRHETKRVGEVEKNFSAYELARQKLGYKPTITMAEGIEKLWQWAQE